MIDADIKILGRANSSNVQKVTWLAGEAGLKTQRVDMGGTFGGLNDASYLKLNPNGVIPTLIDGEAVVWESNTVLRYLCNRYELTQFYPRDSVDRSLVERWMDWQLTTWNPANATLFRLIIRTPIEQRDPDAIELARLQNVSALEVVEQRLAGQLFLASNEFTLADIVMGALAHRWFNLPIERPDFPKVRQWYERLCTRPSFQEHIVEIPFS
jgi:glutathione S-transferase